MAVERSVIVIDKSRHLMGTRGTSLFPCGAYYANVREYLTGDVPWHWHEDIETFVVHSGALHLEVNGAEFTLEAGDGAFVNSNVLHAAQAGGAHDCTLHYVVFGSGMVSGSTDSVFHQRYVRPLLSCHALPCVALQRHIPWQREAAEQVAMAYRACEEEGYGYELAVREHLTHLWRLIVEHHREVLQADTQQRHPDHRRIKVMLQYVHAHYAGPLALEEIAGAANISQRECLRCFQRTIGISPMQYVLRHRVAVAAGLLANTHEPITEICGLTGFDSPSYFAQSFKRLMGRSPSEYRRGLAD